MSFLSFSVDRLPPQYESKPYGTYFIGNGVYSLSALPNAVAELQDYDEYPRVLTQVGIDRLNGSQAHYSVTGSLASVALMDHLSENNYSRFLYVIESADY